MARRPPKREKDRRVPTPLREFNFGLVGERMAGLMVNVDRDLQKRTEQANRAGNKKADISLSLLNVIVRFAQNSYKAVLYIAGDSPADPNRKPNYVLVVPNINRQLLDLLFSLVYMLDDFDYRSTIYQRAAYRELREELHQFKSTFSGDPMWTQHFKNLDGILSKMIERFQITPEEQKQPKLVPYWKHPFELKDEQTASRNFLRYLDKWLYADTSAQAHLSFGGLLRVSAFLVADMVSAEAEQMVQGRVIKQYHFQHISRTAIVTLAIMTEVDTYCNLGNGAAIDYLWVMFSEYVAEAKEMFELRYQNRQRI